MFKKSFILMIALSLFVLYGCDTEEAKNEQPVPGKVSESGVKTSDAAKVIETADKDTAGNPVKSGEDLAVIETNKGKIILRFFKDDAPGHVANFEKLANMGFYDGLTFHRVLPGFMAQGGCPKGDGTGGPGWTIKAEFNDRPHLDGTLSMARAASPDSAGSQFFICFDKQPFLDHKYTVFGQVVEGLDVLHKLQLIDPMRPNPSIKPDVMKKVYIAKKK